MQGGEDKRDTLPPPSLIGVRWIIQGCITKQLFDRAAIGTVQQAGNTDRTPPPQSRTAEFGGMIVSDVYDTF